MNTKYGSAVGLFKDNKVYLSRRTEKVAFGKKWQFANGRMNKEESGQACAVRVVKEQTGLDITKERLYFISTVNIDETSEFYYIYLVHLGESETPFNTDSKFRSDWRLFEMKSASILDLVPGIRHILRKLHKSLCKVEAERVQESIKAMTDYAEYCT